MKKLISVILAVLMLFSTVSVVAFAEGEGDKFYTIRFVDYDGSEIKTMTAQEGAIIPAPENPTREATEKCEYTFKGWSADGGQTIYYQTTIPIATEDVIYMAVYSENEKVEVLTFWAFVSSIFERINQIFEYFHDLFTRNLG